MPSGSSSRQNPKLYKSRRIALLIGITLAHILTLYLLTSPPASQLSPDRHDHNQPLPLPTLTMSTPRTFTDSLPLPKLLVFDLDYTLWPFWVDTHVTPPFRPDPSASPANTVALDREGDKLAFYPGVASVLWAARAAGVPVAAASRSHAPVLARDLLRLLRVHPPATAAAVADDDDGAAAVGAFGGGATGCDDEEEDEDEEDVDGVANTRGNTRSKSKSKSKAKAKRKSESKSKSTSTTGEGKGESASHFFAHMQIYPGEKTTHFRKIQAASGVAYADMIFFDDEARNRNVERELGVLFVPVSRGVDAALVDQAVKTWRARSAKKG